MGTLPKDCALLGGNGNILKIKTTAKLNSKQTSIAAVRNIFRMYATFLTPLGSHYRLPVPSRIQKKYIFFFLITCPQAHHLQSKKFNLFLQFSVKMLYCRHYFSPLNTFMRKRKDPYL
jgi:hypothetical protein